MKIVVDTPLFSPLPEFDWMAFNDSTFPDGPVAYGATPAKALSNLLEQVDGDEVAYAAVEEKIEELTAIVGVPV